VLPGESFGIVIKISQTVYEEKIPIQWWLKSRDGKVVHKSKAEVRGLGKECYGKIEIPEWLQKEEEYTIGVNLFEGGPKR